MKYLSIIITIAVMCVITSCSWSSIEDNIDSLSETDSTTNIVDSLDNNNIRDDSFPIGFNPNVNKWNDTIVIVE